MHVNAYFSSACGDCSTRLGAIIRTLLLRRRHAIHAVLTHLLLLPPETSLSIPWNFAFEADVVGTRGMLPFGMVEPCEIVPYCSISSALAFNSAAIAFEAQMRRLLACHLFRTISHDCLRGYRV